MAKGPFDGFAVKGRSEEEEALAALFPAQNRFQKLQMLTELQPRTVPPWSVSGLFRRLWKSTVLEILQEEYSLNKIAQERKGRLEGTEVYAAVRRRAEEREDKD